MSNIKFIMAARCEAAGRSCNEDNFQLTDDLSGDQWSFVTDHEVELGEKGALLIVCDGMGGTNAGEVASKVAVETVKEWFASGRLTEEILATSESIMQYIEKAIIDADRQIKEEGETDREKEGMGSTIVLAWVIGQSVFVGWCGDSRAYCFNPSGGLKQLSHDHSYVQTLVDSGQLDAELAFDHPNNNIITRCLGDLRQTADPEVREYPLHEGDIIMLCSDGLSGVLRDHVVEEVMRENAGSMAECRDALWDAARNAGWYDNVTIGLCRIVSGINQNATQLLDTPVPQKPVKKRRWWMFVALILGFLAGLFTGIALPCKNHTLAHPPHHSESKQVER